MIKLRALACTICGAAQRLAARNVAREVEWTPKTRNHLKQGGFIHLGIWRALLGGRRGFRVSDLFAQSEPGFHAETYDPNSLLMRRNLLTYSEEFNNGAWLKSALTVTANATPAPDGTLTADLLAPTAAVGTHVTYPTGGIAISSGATYTGRVRVKAGGYGFVAIALNVSSSYAASACLNLSTGALTNAGVSGTYSVTDEGNGWWAFTVTATAASSFGYLELWPRATPGAAGGSITGDGVSGVYAWGAQMEKSAAATDYQKVTDWNTEYMTAALTRIGLWQDSIGVTPVTAVEQPVGFWRDTKNSFTVGGELTVRPYAISGGAGTWSGGATITRNGSTVANTMALGALTATKTYEVTFDVSDLSGDTFTLSVGGGGNMGNVTTNGPKVAHLVAGGGGNIMTLTPWGGAAGQVTISNLSVKEYVGNHAIQATAASRPVLSARYNLLTKTEQFDDAAWTKNGAPVVTPNAVVAPDGTMTADSIAFPTATTSQIWQTVPVTATPITEDLWIRAEAPVTMTFGFFDSAADNSIINVTTAWQKFPRTRASGLTSADRRACWLYANVNNTTVHVWGASLSTTNDAALNQPAYQRVNTATDYDTTGFIHYLRFDGVDDSLATPTITFTGDKMAVWAGVTKISDANVGLLIETSVNSNTTDGAMYVSLPGTAPSSNFGFNMRGTVAQNLRYAATGTSYASPTSRILTARFDTAAAGFVAQNSPLIDGVTPTTMTDAIGPTSAGNFIASPLYIGRRAGASVPANMRLTSLTVRGTTTPTSEAFIAKMNVLAAKLAGQTNVTV